MKFARIPFVMAAAIMGIILGSLILSGIFSDNRLPKIGTDTNSSSASSHTEAASATALHMPVDVREVFDEIEMDGDAVVGSPYFMMENNFVDEESHCEFCIAAAYTPGPYGSAIVAFTKGEGHARAQDLSDANKIIFTAKGEKGGERIRIYAAGYPKDDSIVNGGFGENYQVLSTVRFDVTILNELTLTMDWQKYEVNLDNANLAQITHPFAFEILAGKEIQVIYVDSIFYTDGNVENTLLLN